MPAEMVPVDGRWTCPNCSRFIAASATEWWDELDPGAYYGVTTRYVVNCSGCGRLTDSEVLPPNWTPTRWAPLDPPCTCPTDAEIDAAIAANYYRPAKPKGDSDA